jgi:hypothetical protein
MDIALKVTYQDAVRYYADLADVFAAVSLSEEVRDEIRFRLRFDNDKVLYQNAIPLAMFRVERVTRQDVIAMLNTALASAPAPDSPRYATGPVAEGDIPYAGAGFDDEIYDLHTNELIATCDTADEATALAALLNDRERYETALKAIAAGAGDPAAVAAGALGKE